MDTVWEKIKKGLRDGASVSMEKIEEFSKIGKLKIEEVAAKRKIERNYADIGERVFDMIEEGKSSDLGNDLSVKKSVENIVALREELSSIDAKIKEIQEAAKKKDGQVSDDEEITSI
ncbi:MAG: hypothetical protein JW915_23080 [Chitinispirillaceae bacterium]|nr:hypothetical protein [Chitinispirillaceae bacterium]